MQNIPRRKIYETMLEFEDGLIEMQILNYNTDNFSQYKENFQTQTLPKIFDSYFKIKALLIMFLENKKHEEIDEFEDELKELLKNHKIINEKLHVIKVINKKFLKNIDDIDKLIENKIQITSIQQSKEIFNYFDEFNTHIPEILTIKRDELK